MTERDIIEDMNSEEIIIVRDDKNRLLDIEVFAECEECKDTGRARICLDKTLLKCFIDTLTEHYKKMKEAKI